MMKCTQERIFVGNSSTSCGCWARTRSCLSALVRFGAGWWLDGLFALILFVAFFGLPADVSKPELDNSWCRALQECFKNRAQAGRDYFFTYGPLAALLCRIYEEEMHWHKYVCEWAVDLALAAIIMFFARRIAHKAGRFVFYAVLLVYVTPLYDLRFVVSSLALTILLLFMTPRTAVLVLAGLFLAGLCLFKFTLAVFIGPAILLVTVSKWWETGWRSVVALPLTFAVGTIGLWLATGQALANLPRFVSMSLEIASGYVDAMSVPGTPSSLYQGLAVFGLGILLCLAAAVYNRGTVRSLVCLVLMLAALHLEFRHGFIRHDLHCLNFFGFAMMVPFFIVVIAPMAATRWEARLGFGLTLLLAGQAYQQADGLQAPDVPRRLLALYKNLRNNVSGMIHPCVRRDELRQLEHQSSETYKLPKIKARVGDAGIDMVSCQLGMLFLNGLHWTPRPAFQSYLTYTPKLLSANQEFYRGRSAPRFVLFRLFFIDFRFPSTEDSGVLFELFQHYRPVTKEKDYLLLEHRQETDRTNNPPPLETSERTIRFGEIVPVSSTNGKYSTACFHFHLRKSGKLLHTVYRNPLLYLNVSLSDGSQRRYRLIPEMAARDFLLNPLLENNDDVLGLYCGKDAKRIDSLWVTQEEFYGWHPYRLEFQLILKAYPSTFIRRISAGEAASLR